MYRRAAAAVIGAVLLSGSDATALRKGRSRSELEAYSFEQYVQDFSRDYKVGSEEFRRRGSLFEASLAQVGATNARNTKEGRLWKAGVHPFMDWDEAERSALHGYKPAGRRAGRRGTSFLSSSAKVMNRLNATGYEAVAGTSGGMDINSGPDVRDQGNCGSCWAISAAEALEAQLIKNSGSSPRISAQALVDCVPNPQHCGGKGGCDGATGELAYAWVRDHGIPLESDLKYTARTGECHQSAGLWQAGSRVRVSGWDQLPSNRAQPLMQAMVEKGPVVVAVDGNSWFNYESGVFDGCPKDAILGHAVLAKGYAKDEANNKYWLIQNSWGSEWGESGHIRLLRHDDEDSWCGTDNKPKEGIGCDDSPSEVTVCGTCGLLYDPLVPSGVHVESGSGAGVASFVSSSGSDSEDPDALLKRMQQAMA
mmetsp:Transcript_87390/g.222614  ORF Transcript_87390/g.222614 Transcript_87390/m.222614 type:complete len:423 (-) Transcript_87390:169-1437(-)